MIQLHFDFIWRLLRRSGLSEPRADDAAQEVFLVASQRLADIAVGSERSFLFGTALRVASTVRRSAEFRREHPGLEADVGDTAAGSRVSTEDLVDQHRARAALDAILEELPEDLRTVFVLFEIEGASTPEIAELLGLPLGTATSRLRRAREEFQTRVFRRFSGGRQP